MGPFAAGQIALLPFPFSDLTRSKLRPALLLAPVGRGDWIACQITSNPYADPHAITLEGAAFAEGGLHRVSFVRPGKLFTAHETLFQGVAGRLHQEMLNVAREAVVVLIRDPQAEG